MAEYRVATDRMTAAPPGQAPPEGASSAVVDAEVVDPAVIDQLASITDAQGLSVLSELLQAFLAAAPARLEAIDNAVAHGDMPGVAEQAHALTGSSASFGATSMASLCRRLRAAAEQGDADATATLVVTLNAEFTRVRSSLVMLMRAGV